MPLTHRTVVVSGASRGIGRAVAELLLEGGARVVGIARSTEDIIEHPRYQHHSIDLGDLEASGEALRALSSELESVDGVVSNAGVGHFGGLEQFSLTQIQASIDLNLTSHLMVVRTFLPQLKRNQSSDVVLMGSESALQGGPKGTLYCAAKFGLRGFAQALRQDCASAGVRVTLINPGMVRSSFFDEQSFQPGPQEEHAIEAREVATVAADVLRSRSGMVFDEINLSPLKKVIEFRRGEQR